MTMRVPPSGGIDFRQAWRVSPRSWPTLFAGLLSLIVGCAAERPQPSRMSDWSPETAAVRTVQDIGLSNALPSATRGIPFGFWHLSLAEFRPPFTGAVLNGTDPASVLLTLEAARKAKVQVILNMFVSPRRVKSPDGSFDLGLWQQRIDRFATINLEPYIADGTLAGNMLLDEPHTPSKWNGKVVPYADLEAAAEYSKRLWPGLPTLVRSDPVYLRKAPFKWVYLDAAWAQYAARRGNPEAYAARQAAAARAAGLGLVLGLNLLDGGDGSSGSRGTKLKYWTMSAPEVLNYGAALIKEPRACALLLWKYDRDDTTLFAQPDIQAALDSLGRLAAERPTAKCRIR
jgi:hypothetical protein